jgi:hypothetical protein
MRADAADYFAGFFISLILPSSSAVLLVTMPRYLLFQFLTLLRFFRDWLSQNRRWPPLAARLAPLSYFSAISYRLPAFDTPFSPVFLFQLRRHYTIILSTNT